MTHTEINNIMQDWNYKTLYLNQSVEGKDRSVFLGEQFNVGVDVIDEDNLELTIFVAQTGEIYHEEEMASDDFEDFINAFTNQVFI
jgi:hypothetical protein